MTIGLHKRRKTNGLGGIISKVTSELASPFILYSNHRRDLSEGKRNLRLDYLKRKNELRYERKLNEYKQELEGKLQEPEIFGVINDEIRYLRENYDWEKEKRQIKTIGRGIKNGVGIVCRGVKWTGKKAKVLAQKEWEKEKYVMKERTEKFEQKKDELVQRKKEKLFLEFNKVKKDINQINDPLSKLDSEKNYNYINNLKWQRDKLYKKVTDIADKLRKGDYPIDYVHLAFNP